MTGQNKFIVCVCLCFLSRVAYAKPFSPFLQSTTSQSWMSQKWTADDTPYQHLQSQIDKRLAGGTPPDTLFQEYARQAKPKNALSQFAAGYAGFVTKLATSDTLDAVSQVDPQSAYQYTRLRFLLTRTVLTNNDLRYLQPVGLRLLQRNPQDEIVHKNLVYALSSSRQGAPQALKVAKSWVSQQPQSAGAHAVLASVYDGLFSYSRGKNQNYAQRAIAEYKEYLRLAPPKDHFRHQAVYLIQAIQREKPW